jgi:hypothetical protein
VEELLNKLTREELYNFTIRLIKNNPDLTNAVFLEFSERIENKSGNKYVPIIHGELAGIELDMGDYYDEAGIDIDVLDEWAEKAGHYLKEYLLQIAQGEKDIPALRSISYSFIKDSFREKHYRIYKSSFSAVEWPEQFEKLLQHYGTQKSFWHDPPRIFWPPRGWRNLKIWKSTTPSLPPPFPKRLLPCFERPSISMRRTIPGAATTNISLMCLKK